MISGINNQTLERYIMATHKAVPKQQAKITFEAITETRQKENAALDDRILRNNLLGNIFFLKESDKEIFTQAIV